MEGSMNEFISRELDASLDSLTALHANTEYRATIATVSRLMADAIRSGGKLLFAGNGGSAADSQHIAGELVSRLNFDRPGLPAIALTVDSSILTAIGNDYGYDRVFARQIEALGRPGDVFTAISTSGNSPNILAAIEAATAAGLVVVGMTGGRWRKDGIALRSLPACAVRSYARASRRGIWPRIISSAASLKK
jgi:D-sedoheptulose 7-phosphate isomerase